MSENQNQGQKNDLVFVGYLLALGSIFCFPPVLAVAGIVCGIINMRRGSWGHGLAQILLSIVCGTVGTVLGILLV